LKNSKLSVKICVICGRLTNEFQDEILNVLDRCETLFKDLHSLLMEKKFIVILFQNNTAKRYYLLI